MRRFVIVSTLALLVVGAASADTLDVLVKNTLTLTDTRGGVTTVQISEGGQFEQTNPKGMWAAGFWTKEEGRLCMTARGQAQICMPLEADKGVDDSWEINGPTGRPVWTAAIVEGRETLDKAAGQTAP